MSITSLPDHLLAKIFTYIPYKNLVSDVQAVCRFWKDLVPNCFPREVTIIHYAPAHTTPDRLSFRDHVRKLTSSHTVESIVLKNKSVDERIRIDRVFLRNHKVKRIYSAHGWFLYSSSGDLAMAGVEELQIRQNMSVNFPTSVCVPRFESLQILVLYSSDCNSLTTFGSLSQATNLKLLFLDWIDYPVFDDDFEEENGWRVEHLRSVPNKLVNLKYFFFAGALEGASYREKKRIVNSIAGPKCLVVMEEEEEDETPADFCESPMEILPYRDLRKKFHQTLTDFGGCDDSAMFPYLW